MRARAGICRYVSATADAASSLRHLSLEGTVRHIGTRLEAVAARNRLPGEQRRDGHRVDRWCAVGSGREVRKTEAVPARRGPVVDLSEQGCAAGGEGDVEGAVGGGGEVRFACPAAQEVLDGRGLSGGVGSGCSGRSKVVPRGCSASGFQGRPTSGLRGCCRGRARPTLSGPACGEGWPRGSCRQGWVWGSRLFLGRCFGVGSVWGRVPVLWRALSLVVLQLVLEISGVDAWGRCALWSGRLDTRGEVPAASGRRAGSAQSTCTHIRAHVHTAHFALPGPLGATVSAASTPTATANAVTTSVLAAGHSLPPRRTTGR